MPSVEQQIEQSRAKKKALIKKALLGFTAVLLIGAASVILVTLMQTAVPDADESNTEVSDRSTAVNQSPQPPAQSNFSEEERKALQMALSETKQNVTNLAQRVAHTSAFSHKAKEIALALENAFNEYGAANFHAAKAALDNINRSVTALSNEYETAYTKPFEDALSAFNNNDISSAFNFNRESLSINPDFGKAKALQQRIEVFNEVQDAYEQARVGKVENNIEKQRDAYAKIVNLDPQRQDAKDALDKINDQLINSRFDSLLAKANQAIEQRNFTAATQYINEAKRINPSSNELATINKKLATLVAQDDLNKIESQVTLFASSDEWKTVQLLASKGLASHPTSPTLQTAKQNADAILAASKRLNVYEQRPQRLADDNVRNLAQQDINQARSYAEKSAKLLKQITALEQIVDDINKPRPVTITSDNDTYIKVLGVGLVGEVKSKTIQLKPGTYRIEGSREGYRSTIQEIVVSPTATNLSVHVVCTEKV